MRYETVCDSWVFGVEFWWPVFAWFERRVVEQVGLGFPNNDLLDTLMTVSVAPSARRCPMIKPISPVDFQPKQTDPLISSSGFR